MDVVCIRTQIFLTMILSFQRWIFCAYEQVPRDMDYSAYGRRYSLRCFLIFQRWIICTSLLRFGESISAQNPTMVLRLLRIYRELYKSLFGISAHICKKFTSLLRICVFAQIIQSLTTLLSKITIRNFCACMQKFPRLF